MHLQIKRNPFWVITQYSKYVENLSPGVNESHEFSKNKAYMLLKPIPYTISFGKTLRGKTQVTLMSSSTLSLQLKHVDLSKILLKF